LFAPRLAAVKDIFRLENIDQSSFIDRWVVQTLEASSVLDYNRGLKLLAESC